VIPHIWLTSLEDDQFIKNARFKAVGECKLRAYVGVLIKGWLWVAGISLCDTDTSSELLCSIFQVVVVKVDSLYLDVGVWGTTLLVNYLII
jgi:hypothetical protein